MSGGLQYWRVITEIGEGGVTIADLLPTDDAAQGKVSRAGSLRMVVARFGTSGTLVARGPVHLDSDTPDPIEIAENESINLELRFIDPSTTGCVPIFVGWV